MEVKIHTIKGAERLRKHREWRTNRRFQWLVWGIFLLHSFIHFLVYSSYLSRFFLPEVHWALPLVGVGFISLSEYMQEQTQNRRCFYPIVLLMLLTAYEFWLVWIEFRMS